MDPNFKKIAEQNFEKYDSNKSNFIEIAELKSLMIDVAKECKLDRPDDEEIQDTLKNFDTNQDNKISLEEFMSLFQILYQMKSK